MEKISKKTARAFMKVGLAAMLQELGFSRASNMALETVIEMCISFLTELGRSTHAYTELAGRTQPMLADVVTAMAGMGMGFHRLELYAHRCNRPALRPPTYEQKRRVPNHRFLRSGPHFILPPYIPRFLPPFPDAHTWIKTQSYGEPITEYELVREMDSDSKRAFEHALTKFIVNATISQSLFREGDAKIFPLIQAKFCPQPYLSALLPQDQVFPDEFTLFNYLDDVYPSSQDVEINNPYLRSPLALQPGGPYIVRVFPVKY